MHERKQPTRLVSATQKSGPKLVKSIGPSGCVYELVQRKEGRPEGKSNPSGRPQALSDFKSDNDKSESFD